MIVISGGKGFIGSHLVKAFRGDQTIMSVHTGDSLIEKPDSIEIGFEHPDLPARLKGATAFIHAAGRTKGSDKQLRQAHITATRRYTDLLPKDIKTIIHISSVNVYFSRFDPYGQIKQETEQIWAESAFADRTTILRCALVYGPGDYNNLYRLIALIQRWPLVLIPRAGTLRPVFIQDLVNLIVHLADIKTQTQSPKTWDVSGREAIDLFHLSKAIATLLPSGPIIVPVNQKLLTIVQVLARFLQLKTVSNQIARQNISREWYNPYLWGITQHPTTPLMVGLQKTVDAYLAEKAFA